MGKKFIANLVVVVVVVSKYLCVSVLHIAETKSGVKLNFAALNWRDFLEEFLHLNFPLYGILEVV